MSKQARLKTQEMRKAQDEAARRDARRRRIVVLVGGVVVLALLAAIVLTVVRAAQGEDTPPTGDVVAPANVEEGSIPVGREDAPVSVAIYYDYMCPACGAFESANGDELDRLLDAGEIRIDLRPISFLDRTSMGSEYSTRSANAVATTADASPGEVWAFHRALYEQQPEEGSTGLSDDDIARIARGAGVPDDAVDRFTDDTYEVWVAQITQDAFDSGVEGTPSVLIDGEEFEGDLYSSGALTQAIEAAGQSG